MTSHHHHSARAPAPRRSLLLLLLVLVASAAHCTLLARADAATDATDALQQHTQRAMVDMPSDPVSGEMVMSSSFHFDLKNGQRLRFATHETLTQFLADPSTGLKRAESIDAHDADAAPTTSSALCPVCGMETAANSGPQVSTQHGEQVIKTCSLTHAHQVLDHALLYKADAKDDDTSSNSPSSDADASGFCVGSGTTMLNGFTFGRASNAPCVLLWFPGWVLSTRWRYVVGCFGVALVAVFNEYLLHLRRVLRKESSTLKRLRSGVPLDSSSSYSNVPLSSTEATHLLRSTSYPLAAAATPTCCPAWFRTLAPETQHVVHCVLHGVTIAIAYMLMLVSMTYDWVLFVTTISGYVVGHYVFGERRDAISELHQAAFP